MSEWIKTSQAKPCPNEIVLFCVDGGVHMGTYYKVFGEGHWEALDETSGDYEGGWCHETYEEGRVLHWQPLPEPVKNWDASK